MAEMSGGIVLDAGLQNRGIRSVLKKCAPGWLKLGCPVVVQVAEREFEDVWHVARHLEQTRGAAGIELLIDAQAGASEVATLVGRIAEESELPIWVKLPLARCC